MTFADHLSGIISRVTDAIQTKYLAGQAEHGGQLWRKAGMLQHAEAEVTDLNVYLDTLRMQLGHALTLLSEGRHTEGRDALARILGPAEE